MGFRGKLNLAVHFNGFVFCQVSEIILCGKLRKYQKLVVHGREKDISKRAFPGYFAFVFSRKNYGDKMSRFLQENV